MESNTGSTAVAVAAPSGMTLPDEATFRHDVAAINRFQQVVRATMVSGQDYGVIPGTQKPTLLKPGAEKIAKLLGLSDDYEIVDRQEDWAKGFFRYLIKCQLKTVNGVLMSSGLGECNSMESKYRWRWSFASALPPELQGDAGKAMRDKLQSKQVSTRNGPAKMYRLDNEDIYSQVNTILKMAKKRALVDAALSAGRLSEVFTQDIEDIGPEPEPEPEPVHPKTAVPVAQVVEQAPQAESRPQEAARSQEKAAQKRDLASITSFGALYTACREDFGIKTRAEVWRELGVSSQEAITELPSKCYEQIAAVRAR